jgi:hypothetical protein
MRDCGQGPAHVSSGAGEHATTQASIHVFMRYVDPMANEDDQKDPKKETEEGDPVADLKRGVGLLFRAAKNAAQQAKDSAKDNVQTERVEKAFKSGVDELHKAIDRLQSDKLEGAIKTSLQEIGRAFGNVAQTLERELRDEPGKDKDKKE